MAQGALQRLLDDQGTLSHTFTIAVLRHVVEASTSEKLGSAAAGTGSKGRVSAVRHDPLTLEQKFALLKQKINEGKIKLAPHVTIDAIKHELMSNRDSYKDLSPDKIEERLKSKEVGMLQEVKAPVHRPMDPRPLIGMAVAAFASKRVPTRVPAPAFA